METRRKKLMGTLDETMVSILVRNPNLPEVEAEVEKLARSFMSEVDRFELPKEYWVRRKSFAQILAEASPLREQELNIIRKKTLDGEMAKILSRDSSLSEEEVEKRARELMAMYDYAEIPKENWVRKMSFAEITEEAQRLSEHLHR